MNYRLAAALMGASAFALGSAAAAQNAPAGSPAAAAPADQATLGEIVVTARRRAESLQEVPQTVNAVTSDTLQKLNMTKFSDVQTVVPGLSLDSASNGYSASASMRGLTFDVNTAAPLGTVATYMNDVYVQTSFLFNSMFDIGQIEVLKGPQGTTRGVSTPSGAITATTHRPDLSSFGGYANISLTDQQGRNAQGALNIPLINDVLAVRVAGVIDQNNVNGVRSLHNSLRPSGRTMAERISVSFEPSDVFNANLMYQHLDNRFMVFDQVSGPGIGANAAGLPTASLFAGGVNPPLSPFDRAAVEDGISDARRHDDLVTLQVDSRIFGQHLSYVGSYAFSKTHARNLGTTNSADVGNIIPGVETFNFQDVVSTYTTQEIRLASDPAPGRFFDYTVGAFYRWSEVDGLINPGGNAFTFGAFGQPFGVNVAAFNPAYVQTHVTYNIPSNQQETSLFGSVTLHLGPNTELSGGIRHMWAIVDNNVNIHLGNGLIAVPAGLFGGACTGAVTPSPYPGFCNLTIDVSGITVPPIHTRDSQTPNIYNASLSHHFTRDFLAYVNTGTSFRSGFISPGIQSNALLTSTDPALQTLTSHPAERSRSYEVGFKSTFLDGRARLNADIFRQRFDGFTVYVPNINYVSNTGVATFNFTQSVDALVQGFEIDAAYQVTRDWNVALLASYADGKIQGSLVPWNTFDGAGNPTFNHTFISMCPGGSASRLPLWNASLTSEYDHEIRDGVQGFIRGLFSYYPENKRVEPGLTVDSYGLLNLYAGVRSQDGAWEVSIFSKNALRNNTLLDKSPVQANLNSLFVSPSQGGYGGFFPTQSGYYVTQVTPAREVGVNLRYAWGSR